MGEGTLFKGLGQKQKIILVEMLRSAYKIMSPKQRRSVFGEFEKLASSSAYIDGKKSLKAIRIFQKDSLDKRYYESFEINSKNWLHIPEKTEEWFDHLGAFLEQSTRLSRQGDYVTAVKCFRILYQLIEAVDDGDSEIVFADELGSWMVSGDLRKFAGAYLLSMARTANSEDFAKTAFSLICRENYPPHIDQVYRAALRTANKEQRLFLEEEIESQKTSPRAHHLFKVICNQK